MRYLFVYGGSMNDALSRLLDQIRPQGAVVVDHRSLPSDDRPTETGAAVTVVAVTDGPVRLAVDDRPAFELAAGAVALLLGAHRYRVTAGGGVAGPALVTGRYAGGGGVCDRVLGGLPSVLLVDGGGDTAAAVDLLGREVTGSRPGRRALLDRLTDLVLLSALRDWLDRPDSKAPAWYRAQSDAAVGAALDLIHAEPGRPWTVARLADRCGLSRSAFARRFTALVGEPPMSYLTCWRLCLATDLLRETDATLAVIAKHVGYANGYALSAVFTRFFGLRPGEYRRARSTTDDSVELPSSALPRTQSLAG